MAFDLLKYFKKYIKPNANKHEALPESVAESVGLKDRVMKHKPEKHYSRKEHQSYGSYGSPYSGFMALLIPLIVAGALVTFTLMSSRKQTAVQFSPPTFNTFMVILVIFIVVCVLFIIYKYFNKK